MVGAINKNKIAQIENKIVLTLFVILKSLYFNFHLISKRYIKRTIVRIKKLKNLTKIKKFVISKTGGLAKMANLMIFEK